MPELLRHGHATLGEDRPTGGSTEGLSVEELGRIVGMSPRNIRAHQARRLLTPPSRRGRVVFYDDRHVHRLRTIVALQRQGFNLVSIEAILGVRDADPGTPTLTPTLDRLATQAPALMRTLAKHRVVARAEDGVIHSARPQVTRAALKLRSAGVSPTKTLQMLGEILERLGPITEELIRTSSARVLAQMPHHDQKTSGGDQTAGDGGRSIGDLDQDAAALTEGIVDLLSEAFRVTVDNCGETMVAALVEQRHGLDFETDVDATQSIDNG